MRAAFGSVWFQSASGDAARALAADSALQHRDQVWLRPVPNTCRGASGSASRRPLSAILAPKLTSFGCAHRLSARRCALVRKVRPTWYEAFVQPNLCASGVSQSGFVHGSRSTHPARGNSFQSVPWLPVRGARSVPDSSSHLKRGASGLKCSRTVLCAISCQRLDEYAGSANTPHSPLLRQDATARRHRTCAAVEGQITGSVRQPRRATHFSGIILKSTNEVVSRYSQRYASRRLSST